jgi:hypothetical protein
MDPTDPLGSRRLNPRNDTYQGLADVSIEDFNVDVDALADLSFNPVAHHERMVVQTLRDGSGREYDSGGFSRRTLREITQDLRHDGHRPGAILVPYDGTDLFDGDRLHYTGESTAVTDVNFHGWPVSELKTPDVLDGDAFVIAENALTNPTVAPVDVLVRHPDGVAHYRFGGD